MAQTESDFSKKFWNFVIKGVGFFTNAYVYFGVNVVNIVLSKMWDPFYETRASEISLSIFVGAVSGQLVMGALADQFGRKKIMLVASSFQILGAALACSAYATVPYTQLRLLAFYLALLGFGIGAEYPLSATSSAESTETVDERAPTVALVFSLQGVGAIVAASVGAILIAIFLPGHEPYPVTNLNIVWRLMFALAIIPVALIFPLKWKMEETKDFQQAVTSTDGDESAALKGGDGNNGNGSNTVNNTDNVVIAEDDPITLTIRNLTYVQKIGIVWRHYFSRLIGTAIPWFLFDIVFYAQAIFSGIVVSRVGTGDNLVTISTKNLLVVLGAIPGYYVAVFFINRMGRKRMQMSGFVFMSIIFFVMFIAWKPIIRLQGLFIFLYALTFFFANFGPNTTTFILPVETFPTAIRSTCHGISSASAKIGAFVGVAVFTPLQKAYGTQAPFLVCSLVAIAGLIVTIFFVASTPKLPQELDDEFRKYIEDEMTLLGGKSGDDDDMAAGDATTGPVV